MRSSDKNKMKLAERLNNLYDAAMSENKVLDTASIQQEVKSFWRTIKENRELTFKSRGSQGDYGNQRGSGNQRNFGNQSAQRYHLW